MSSSSEIASVRARVLRADRVSPSSSNVFSFADVHRSTAASRAAAAAAYREGWDAGLEEGIARCRQDLEDEVERHRGALGAIAHGVDRAVAEHVRRLAEEQDARTRSIAEAALQLAEAVIGRELGESIRLGHAGMDAVARALTFAPEYDATGSRVVARLHPEDAATVDASDFACRPTVVPDPSMQRGDCVVEIGDRRIDARIEASLARAREAMLGSPADEDGDR